MIETSVIPLSLGAVKVFLIKRHKKVPEMLFPYFLKHKKVTEMLFPYFLLSK